MADKSYFYVKISRTEELIFSVTQYFILYEGAGKRHHVGMLEAIVLLGTLEELHIDIRVEDTP